MAALQFILGILLLLCMAAMVLLIGHWSPLHVEYELMALPCLVLAIILGVYGIRTTSWNTTAKISTVIEKLDGEIAELKTRLSKLQ